MQSRMPDPVAMSEQSLMAHLKDICEQFPVHGVHTLLSSGVSFVYLQGADLQRPFHGIGSTNNK